MGIRTGSHGADVWVVCFVVCGVSVSEGMQSVRLMLMLEVWVSLECVLCVGEERCRCRNEKAVGVGAIKT